MTKKATAGKNIKIFPLILLGILAVGLLSAVILSGRRQDIRNRAYYGTVELSMSQTASQPEVMLGIKAGTFKISAVNMELEFDGSKLDLRASTDPTLSDVTSFNLPTVLQSTVVDINTTPASGTKMLKYTALSQNYNSLPTGNFTFAGVNFTPKIPSGETILQLRAKEISGVNESGNDNSLYATSITFTLRWGTAFSSPTPGGSSPTPTRPLASVTPTRQVSPTPSTACFNACPGGNADCTCANTECYQGYCRIIPTTTRTPVTPSPTVPAGTCPKGDLGNITCDNLGEIDGKDLSMLLVAWSSDFPVPTPNRSVYPNAISADIHNVGESAGHVDNFDLSKLLWNWTGVISQ